MDDISNLFKKAFEILDNDYLAIQSYLKGSRGFEYDLDEIKKLHKSYLNGLKQKQAEAERKNKNEKI